MQFIEIKNVCLTHRGLHFVKTAQKIISKSIARVTFFLTNICRPYRFEWGIWKSAILSEQRAVTVTRRAHKHHQTDTYLLIFVRMYPIPMPNVLFSRKSSKFLAIFSLVWCQIVLSVKLSTVPNCPFLLVVSNCPGVKLSAVSYCPQCQIVPELNCPTPFYNFHFHPFPGLIWWVLLRLCHFGSSEKCNLR